MSGTNTLLLPLRSFWRQSEDEVALPDFTFFATASGSGPKTGDDTSQIGDRLFPSVKEFSVTFRHFLASPFHKLTTKSVEDPQDHAEYNSKDAPKPQASRVPPGRFFRRLNQSDHGSGSDLGYSGSFKGLTEGGEQLLAHCDPALKMLMFKPEFGGVLELAVRFKKTPQVVLSESKPFLPTYVRHGTHKELE